MLPLSTGMGRVLRSDNGVNKIPGILLTASRSNCFILCAHGQTPSIEHAKRAWRNARHPKTGKLRFNNHLKKTCSTDIQITCRRWRQKLYYTIYYYGIEFIYEKLRVEYLKKYRSQLIQLQRLTSIHIEKSKCTCLFHVILSSYKVSYPSVANDAKYVSTANLWLS